jgi:ZIP family zinc transporter
MAHAHRALGGHGEVRLGSLRGADAAKALAIIAVMTVHSFAEGVGVSFGRKEAR